MDTSPNPNLSQAQRAAIEGNRRRWSALGGGAKNRTTLSLKDLSPEWRRVILLIAETARAESGNKP